MRGKKEINSEKKQYIEMVLSDANTVLEIRKKKKLKRDHRTIKKKIINTGKIKKKEKILVLRMSQKKKIFEQGSRNTKKKMKS